MDIMYFFFFILFSGSDVIFFFYYYVGFLSFLYLLFEDPGSILKRVLTLTASVGAKLCCGLFVRLVFNNFPRLLALPLVLVGCLVNLKATRYKKTLNYLSIYSFISLSRVRRVLTFQGFY